MLPEIHQDVHERMAHSPRRVEGTRMVAIVPYPPAAAERAVNRAGEADGEAADSTGERAPVLGLRDEMDVVCTENSRIRNSAREDAARARRTAGKISTARSVTCTGWVA